MPRRHIIRKLMPSYTALYRSKSGDRIVVKTLEPQPEKRKFRVAGGLRTFRKVKESKHLQEVIIVAKSTKTKTKKEVVDDELDELEGLEELDDLEDEVEDDEEEDEDEPEDEDEDDDEDDDEDEEEEAPVVKKKSKPRQSRASANGMVGTQEVAEFCGVDGRTLRVVLRKLREKDEGFKPDSETGRYQWKSLKDPQVKKIKKAIDGGLHNELKNESLTRLKESQAEKKAAKAKDATSKTKKDKKKKKRSDDDE